VIGKKVPTKDNSFKIEVSDKELEELSAPQNTFCGDWLKLKSKAEEPQERNAKAPNRVTIIALDDDNNPMQVTEYNVTSASIKLDGVEYNIPFGMACSALQNAEEIEDIKYVEKEKE